MRIKCKMLGILPGTLYIYTYIYFFLYKSQFLLLLLLTLFVVCQENMENTQVFKLKENNRRT